MKLYVSGPMTGHPEHNFPAFRAAAAQLRAAGYAVLDPSDKGIIPGFEWEDYLRLDIKQMLDCDGVATLPGWIYSRGASLEVHVARALSMKAFPVEHWLAEARRAA